MSAIEDPGNLQDVIDNVQTQMLAYDAYSPEFIAMNEQLEKLYRMKASEKPDKVSKDAMLAVGGNLAGILLILNYERVHVVTSKALGFVIKSKL